MGHITATWTAPPSTYPDGTPFTNLAGYRVSVGTAPGVYTMIWNLGPQTLNWFIPGLVVDTLYYVAIQAFDSLGNFSVYSPESSLAALQDDPMPSGGLMSNYRVIGR